MTSPLVSVVIPSIGRPSVNNAISSALNQNGVEVEVLVCEGSPKVDLKALVKAQSNAQVIVVPLKPNQIANGNSARQNGIKEARGEFIALLDDDDSWHPDKLRLQLEALSEAGANFISATSCLTKGANGSERVWPLDPPREKMRVAEYLFIRKSIKSRHPLIQTSTLVGPATIFRQFQFDPGIKIHQDWDWLIKIDLAGIGIKFLELPLCIYDTDSYGSAKSRTSAADSHDWIKEIRWSLTLAEYAEFLAGTLNSRYLSEGNLRQAIKVLLEAISTRRLGLNGLVVATLRTLVSISKVRSKKVLSD